VCARDTLCQRDIGSLIVSYRNRLDGGLLVEDLGSEAELGWQERQVDELERTNIADRISWTRAWEAALIEAAQTFRRRRLAYHIVPGVDRRAAILQCYSLGLSAVLLKTTGIQKRVYAEDVMAVVGDG